MTRQTLRILLKDKIAGIIILKTKALLESNVKMVYRRILLHFASLIMFMEGLYFDNDKFLFFSIAVSVAVVFVVAGFVTLLLF